MKKSASYRYVKCYIYLIYRVCAYIHGADENQLKCENLRFLSELSEVNSRWIIFNLKEWTYFKNVPPKFSDGKFLLIHPLYQIYYFNSVFLISVNLILIKISKFKWKLCIWVYFTKPQFAYKIIMILILLINYISKLLTIFLKE